MHHLSQAVLDFFSTCILIPRWHIPHHCHWNCPGLVPEVFLPRLRYFHPETNSHLEMWAGCQLENWQCPSLHPLPCPLRQRNLGLASCYHCCCWGIQFPPQAFQYHCVPWLQSSAWSGAKLFQNTERCQDQDYDLWLFWLLVSFIKLFHTGFCWITPCNESKLWIS